MSDYFLNHVNELNEYRKGIALSNPPYWVQAQAGDQKAEFDGWVCCEADNTFAYIYTVGERDRIMEHPIIIQQCNIKMMAPIIVNAINVPEYLLEKYDKTAQYYDHGWQLKKHPKGHADG